MRHLHGLLDKWQCAHGFHHCGVLATHNERIVPAAAEQYLDTRSGYVAYVFRVYGQIRIIDGKTLLRATLDGAGREVTLGMLHERCRAASLVLEVDAVFVVWNKIFGFGFRATGIQRYGNGCENQYAALDCIGQYGFGFVFVMSCVRVKRLFYLPHAARAEYAVPPMCRAGRREARGRADRSGGVSDVCMERRPFIRERGMPTSSGCVGAPTVCSIRYIWSYV